MRKNSAPSSSPFDPPPSVLDTLILFALTGGPQHGYAIEGSVTNNSYGRIHTHTGVIYKALTRLVRDGYIIQLESDSTDRRHYYELTNEGNDLLRRNTQLLSHISRLAQTPLPPL